MKDTADVLQYLDPKVLARVSRLDVVARMVMEGFVSGMHKSPYRGFSVEFAQHREYVPGDDVKHIDWRAYGKTDRYYIKEYEEETNLRATILLDTSESMRYGSGDVTKFQYGCFIAASLAYMLVDQSDAVGLGLFDDQLRRFLPAKNSSGHLRNLLQVLNETSAKEKTNLDSIFHDVAERINKRGLIIVISDLFYDEDKVLAGLRHFRHRQHDVIVFNLWDERELTFPFQEMTQFEGLEEWGNLLINPVTLQKAYLDEVNAFTDTLRKHCRNNRIDYVKLSTAQPLDVALSAYMAARSKGAF